MLRFFAGGVSARRHGGSRGGVLNSKGLCRGCSSVAPGIGMGSDATSSVLVAIAGRERWKGPVPESTPTVPTVRLAYSLRSVVAHLGVAEVCGDGVGYSCSKAASSVDETRPKPVVPPAQAARPQAGRHPPSSCGSGERARRWLLRALVRVASALLAALRARVESNARRTRTDPGALPCHRCPKPEDAIGGLLSLAHTRPARRVCTARPLSSDRARAP